MLPNSNPLIIQLRLLFFFKILFIFGCAGSSLLHVGGLSLAAMSDGVRAGVVRGYSLVAVHPGLPRWLRR